MTYGVPSGICLWHVTSFLLLGTQPSFTCSVRALRALNGILGAQLFLGLGAGLELCHGATQEQPGPVRWEVLMMALQGQLKVGLDTEQACQGAVTHTRSTWQPQQPVTQPSLVVEVGAWEPVCAPPLLHYVNPNVY